MLNIQTVSNRYIPKPDETTPRNLTVQKVALLGIALGIGTGLFTAHWIIVIGVLALSSGLYYVSKNIDVLRVPTDIKNHVDWKINWLLLSMLKKQPHRTKALLFLGANPNQISEDVVCTHPYTPLIWAIMRQNQQQARLFLEFGADPNLEFPLHRNVEHLTPDLIDLCCEYGANVNALYKGKSLLQHAQVFLSKLAKEKRAMGNAETEEKYQEQIEKLNAIVNHLQNKKAVVTG